MNKLKWLLRINRRWWVSLLVIAVIITCVILGFQLDRADRFYDVSILDLDAGWTDENGQAFRLSDLPYASLTLERSVEDIDLANMRFCTKSIDTFFELLADGEVVYVYQPQQAAFLGKSYGMYIHSIPVPADTKLLTLRLTQIYDDAPPALLNTMIEDPGMFIGDVFKEGLPGFCMCLLMLLLGIIMIVSGAFAYQGGGNQQMEFLMLGVFAVLAAVWSVNDTLIVQTITQNPAMVRLLNYVSLMFLPYFIVAFIASAANKQDSRLLPVLFTMTCVNFLLNVGFTLTGHADYFNLVKISQAIIVIALGMAAYLVVTAIRRKQIEKRFLRIFVVGLCVLGVGTGIDLVRFRATSNVVQGTSGYARMGSLVFLLLIGLYLIGESRRIRIENSRALARLAYTDGLTGMKNRQAFNEAESTLLQDPEAKCMIIQFDINNLKLVNDVHGHAEGDRHISGAAKIIRDCIVGAGECYRTGGDEFIAIMQSDDEVMARQAVRRLEELVRAYNAKEQPPVLLDIAYGMALFRAEEGSLEEAELLADKRMYECKHFKKQHPPMPAGTS